MNTFEVIGYAVLAIVVILVCIVVFTKLVKSPSTSISVISDSTTKNVESCKTDPANCDPLGKLSGPVVSFETDVLAIISHNGVL